jgi:predicted DNA binding CopG/RHH family protein
MEEMSDDQAYDYYADDSHQQLGERVTERIPRPRMTGHVPVRFPEETIACIKAIADHDGLTVSTWIRRVVMHEIERRLPSASIGRTFEVSWTFSPQRPTVTTAGAKIELAPV